MPHSLYFNKNKQRLREGHTSVGETRYLGFGVRVSYWLSAQPLHLRRQAGAVHVASNADWNPGPPTMAKAFSG